MEPTNNQKDLLFRLSQHIKEYVLEEDIDNPRQLQKIQKYVGSLVDDMVVKDEDSREMELCILNMISLVRLSR